MKVTKEWSVEIPYGKELFQQQGKRFQTMVGSELVLNEVTALYAHMDRLCDTQSSKEVCLLLLLVIECYVDLQVSHFLVYQRRILAARASYVLQIYYLNPMR